MEIEATGQIFIIPTAPGGGTAARKIVRVGPDPTKLSPWVWRDDCPLIIWAEHAVLFNQENYRKINGPIMNGFTLWVERMKLQGIDLNSRK